MGRKLNPEYRMKVAEKQARCAAAARNAWKHATDEEIVEMRRLHGEGVGVEAIATLTERQVRTVEYILSNELHGYEVIYSRPRETFAETLARLT